MSIKKSTARKNPMRQRPIRLSIEQTAKGSREFRLLLHRAVPVLGGLAVTDAPHVEPGGCVALRRVLRILVLTRKRDEHEIASGDDRNYLRLHLVRNRSLRPAAEEFHHRVAAGADIG